MDEIRITEKTLDLKKIFRDKAPRIYRWIPGFVFAYLKRKLHQDELNEFLFQNKDKMDYDFVKASLDRLGVKFEVIGLENVPKTGKCTLAANHPLGGPEGLGLLHIISEVRKDLTFLANDILMRIPNLKSLFTPVNKHGSNMEYVKIFNETFASDKMILIFPSGLVSRRQFGKIRDLIWKSSFISRAIKYDRLIIPCHVGGRNSSFFYNLASIRSFLRIRANLEMFQLPDEMFRQQGKIIRVTIGKPIHPSIFDARINKHNWSAMVKDYVYELEAKPDLVFDNEYVNKKLAQ